MQMLIAPSGGADRNLVGCPALFHNLTNFAVVLTLVLAEHSGCFRVSRRIWVWVTQQGLQREAQHMEISMAF
jgi:hypothetical protein